MQILGLSKINTTAKALVGSAMLSLPMSGCYAGRNATPPPQLPTKMLPAGDSIKISTPKESPLTKGLPRTVYTNDKGRMVETFEQDALWALRGKLLAAPTPSKYTFPIDTAYKPYIAAEDVFGAPKGILPNFGVAISVKSEDSNKPVAILSPIKGIIVGQEAPKNRLGRRSTQIMGTDGKIYSFEHLASQKDYQKLRRPLYQKIGTPINANDTLGLIAKTPQTDTYKLHVGVQDMKEELEQLQNYTWQGLRDYFGAKINGSVNPLDSSKSGGIAKLLNQYKIEKGKIKIMPLMKELY